MYQSPLNVDAMAKKTTKSVAKKAAKSVNPPAGRAGKKATTKSQSKTASSNNIEKINEAVLAKLQSLNIEHSFQDEIQWCLGSYRNDKNPIGLYVMAERAIELFRDLAVKDPKAISKKLVADIEKVLKTR